MALGVALVLGAGAAGAQCSDSGLGGTGVRAGDPDDGSGFGGTGARPCAAEPFGVAGVITGFGSIFVGGQEIHYDAATPVRGLDGTRRAGALRLGQTVTAVAQRHDTYIEAREITLAPVLVGPVSATGKNALRALGQLVRHTQTTRIPAVRRADLARGDWVAVYGLRAADGSVVATRIVRRATGTRVYLEGTLRRDADGAWRIGDQIVRLPGATDAAARPGAVAVEGTLGVGGVLHATRLAPTAAAGLLQALAPEATIVLEGFVEDLTPHALRLAGLVLPLGPGVLQIGPAPVKGGYVRVTAAGLRAGGGARLLETDAASVWPGLPQAPERDAPTLGNPHGGADDPPALRLLEPPLRHPDAGTIEPPRLPPMPEWRFPGGL
jgi:hypothetical protein